MRKEKLMSEQKVKRNAQMERVGKEMETSEAQLMDDILEAENMMNAPPRTTLEEWFL